MSLFHLALFIQPRTLHHSSRVHLWPLLCSTLEHSDLERTAVKFCCHNTPLKCLPTSFTVYRSGIRINPLRAVPLSIDAREPLVEINYDSNGNSNASYDETGGRVGETTCNCSKPVVTCSMKELKEMQRRRRIGLANKGRVPWNKGRKHSSETRARIREGTLEALRDPKTRRKMSQAPRRHSEISKEKIRSSLRKVWAERLKWKHSREKLYSLWADCIAKAAKRGGINEEELDWDSYERLKSEMAIQRLEWAEEKAQEKEMKRIRKEKRAEEIASLAHKEMSFKQKGKPMAKPEALTCRKEDNEELAIMRELNVRARLTKIHGKKLIDGPLCNALERLDIESIKREQMRNRISLADQIQAAKSRRTQVVASGSSSTTSSLGE